jgi:hypothetical protein
MVLPGLKGWQVVGLAFLALLPVLLYRLLLRAQ